MIAQKVDEAIARYLDRPEFFPERHSIGKNTSDELLGQVGALLQTYAPKFEATA